MKLRTILFILALLGFLPVSIGGYFYYSAVRESELKEVELQAVSQARRISNRVSSFLAENQKIVGALAAIQEVQTALGSQDPGALERADTVLDHFQSAFNVSVCYLINTDGLTVASSNRNAPDSFVGQYYGFREYFKHAIQGSPAICMALGVTSKKRGVYYSHPIYDKVHGMVIGVAVVKAAIEVLEEELSHIREGAALLTDPNGLVFASNRQDWLYHLLWCSSPELIQKLKESKQFGDGPWESIGLRMADDGHAVSSSGNRYLIYPREVDKCPGWNVIFLVDFDRLSEGVLEPIKRSSGPIILAVAALVGGSVFFLYRAASKDITRRRLAEEALKESEERFRAIFEKTPAVKMLVDPETRTVIDANPAACRFYGYPLPKLRGMSVFNINTLPEQELIAEISRAAREERNYFLFQHRIASGEIRDVEVHTTAIDFRDQRLLCTIIHDVTGRKRAEEALRDSERNLRALSSRLLTAQEEERKRIAHELHDSIGASLGAIKYSLHNTGEHLQDCSPVLFESVSHLVEMTQHTIDEVRRICMDLRPSLLDDLGVIATIDWFCRQFQSIHNDLHIEKLIGVSEGQISETLKIVIFRIMQEAFHNIAKYSRADQVKLSLQQGNGAIELVITDNGVGFDFSSAAVNRADGGGMGLTSMKERAELSGGCLSIQSTPGQGATVHAMWPVPARH